MYDQLTHYSFRNLKLNVLIISSEILNEKNILPSIFELSQAKILKSKGIKVSILSVGTIYSASNIIKAIIKKLAFQSKTNTLSQEYSIYLLLRILLSTYTGKYPTLKQTVEGIPVFIGMGSIRKKLIGLTSSWVTIGLSSFEYYKKQNNPPDIIHAHSRFLLAAVLARRIREKFQIPYVVTEHSDMLFNENLTSFEVSSLNKAYTYASSVIAVSSVLSKQIKRVVPYAGNINILPNVLDSKFESIKLLYENKDSFSFINIASLDKNKNQSILIHAFHKAFAKRNEIKLKIIGDGELRTELNDLIIKLNLQNQVSLLGYLTTKEVINELLQSNAFVLTSKFETFGVVLIEAMACGLPVISTRSGGPEEVVSDSVGLLVNQNVVEISNAMTHFEQRRTYWNRAEIRSECIRCFGTEEFYRKILKIYNTCIT